MTCFHTRQHPPPLWPTSVKSCALCTQVLNLVLYCKNLAEQGQRERHSISQHQQVLVILQALQTLDKVISEKLEDLSEITATPTSQLKFVTDAWSQVVDCRRMLKWTYAFGYYRFADDSAPNKPQQEFFEFNQVDMLQMRVMLQQHVAHCSTFSNSRKMTVSQ